MRDLQQVKQKKAPKPHSTPFMNAPTFAPRRIEPGQCENRLALWEFQCTRGKLLSILRRHERIDSILEDVKHRIEPMHFLLSTAEAKIRLYAAESAADQVAALGSTGVAELQAVLEADGRPESVHAGRDQPEMDGPFSLADPWTDSSRVDLELCRSEQLLEHPLPSALNLYADF